MLEYLGFLIDAIKGTFGVSAAPLEKVDKAALRLIKLARCNALRVSSAVLS